MTSKRHRWVAVALVSLAGCGKQPPPKPAPPAAKPLDLNLGKYETAQLGAARAMKNLLDSNPKLAEAAGARAEHTPLLTAVASGQLETVEVLLDAGADMEVFGPDNLTPLQVAVRHNHEPAALLLLDRGARFDASTPRGEALLRDVLVQGHAQVLARLFTKGVDPDLRIGGVPLLGVAAKAGRADVVRLLVARGANRAGLEAEIAPLLQAPPARPAAPPSAPAPKTNAAAAPATPAAPPASCVGMTLDAVKRALGQPKMQGKHGTSVVLVYGRREISASDGITVDRDTGE